MISGIKGSGAGFEFQNQSPVQSVTQKQDETITERDASIVFLQQQVHSLSQQLQESLRKLSLKKQSQSNLLEKEKVKLSPSSSQSQETYKNGHAGKVQRKTKLSLDATIFSDDSNNRTLSSRKQRLLGRSITTQSTLQILSMDETSLEQRNEKQEQQQPGPSIANEKKGQNNGSAIPKIIDRIQLMFAKPTEYMGYLKSKLFAKDIICLCKALSSQLERTEPRVVYIQSPVYVFGDIHGNLEDLHFFSDNVWRLGMQLTAGNFLFLGDYVDRGMNCLETVSYLFAMKYSIPTKVYLLRGNHETRDVNGWDEYYKEKAFVSQCETRFGTTVGRKVWEACNAVFDRLPLAAIIDQDIFCVHGGIPRPIPPKPIVGGVVMKTTRIQDILMVPPVAGINPPYDHEDDFSQQVASDCIWSDPASVEQELTSVDPNTGFGSSTRGGGAICFGNKAVSDFLIEQGMSYIMRAHEAHAHGVALCKNARVFTVFSTSKDHHQGSAAMAGCVLVDDETIRVINRSPHYKNHYIHSRDSVSLRGLSPEELRQRMDLGLISKKKSSKYYDTESDDDDVNDDTKDFVMEEWNDLSEESEEDQLISAPLNQSRWSAPVAQAENKPLRRKSIDLSALTSVMNDLENKSGVYSKSLPDLGFRLLHDDDDD